jgi:hypothetical protein
MFRLWSMPHKITAMTAKLALTITILLGGCAQVQFEATPAGSQQAILVGNSQDVFIAGKPLEYRMRAVDGHLVFWIDNPTSEPAELLGDKSDVVDPGGVSHALRGQIIGAQSSIKLIFPPMQAPAEEPPPNPAAPVSPYDRPGFIPIPDILSGPDENNFIWQWDDELDIQLNLFFRQDGLRFEQHFSILRERK